MIISVDPCERMLCGAGRVCQQNGDEAKCVCIPDCPEEHDARRHVCTNKNETWPSDCSVYQQRCLCDTQSPGCLHAENSHLHIDYYGVCHEHQVRIIDILSRNCCIILYTFKGVH